MKRDVTTMSSMKSGGGEDFFRKPLPLGLGGSDCLRLIHPSSQTKEAKCSFLGLLVAILIKAHLRIFLSLGRKGQEEPEGLGKRSAGLGLMGAQGWGSGRTGGAHERTAARPGSPWRPGQGDPS